ncbi:MULTISPECIES: hypothetical protein [Ruminococcus]|uniref:Conserved domain protein n=1 Tax=Ruminococcus albus 8 TaxID=246199 RepID=E9SDP4_RUMAL|nr:MULTISPECIES: hypothetical protein [Ruminococcus]MBE6872559.1 hypothetical protein [Ruminococcus albus]EGC02620.1 conserved domain protein [Ruminococcus albus 8]MBQ9543410.1 hypothetical protein [Ruminococcus sp.]MBR0530329.1 hypothetical protein [Ruminococcus sp.]MCC3350077.1 hypothetical protein [Ruminococcus albus 8]
MNERNIRKGVTIAAVLAVTGLLGQKFIEMSEHFSGVMGVVMSALIVWVLFGVFRRRFMR